MRLVLLIVLGLSIAGCGLFDDSNRPPRVGSGSPGELEDALVQWEAADIDHYRFEYTQACECLPLGPIVVEVQDGIVRDVEALGENTLPEGFEPFTVERLFAAIEEAYEQDAASVAATYSEVSGFPVSVAVDYDVQIADEELYIEVQGFEQLGD